jgi:hypothetical protein
MSLKFLLNFLGALCLTLAPVVWASLRFNGLGTRFNETLAPGATANAAESILVLGWLWFLVFCGVCLFFAADRVPPRH